jgi:hypothetical protein
MLVYYTIEMDMITIYLTQMKLLKKYFQYQNRKELKQIFDDHLHWKYHQEIFVVLN